MNRRFPSSLGNRNVPLHSVGHGFYGKNFDANASVVVDGRRGRGLECARES
jgi:hypothetical protein